MMRKLMGTWLVVCVCAGCAAAQENPPAQAPPPAESATADTAAAPDAAGALTHESPVDAVLDALDRRGDELKDFTAVVTLADTDTALGNETKLTGRIWMQRLGADDARLRVLFDRKEVNERATNERQEFMLTGGLLTERNYVDRTEIRRQVLKPGQKMNLLKLGEGPFPLPLGQAKEDVHQMFEVKKFEPATGDPAGSIHVQLIPKKGTQFESRFSMIDFWVDPKIVMPVRIVTQDPNGTTERTAELKEIQVNAGLGDKEFTLSAIDEKDWSIRHQPYDE